MRAPSEAASSLTLDNAEQIPARDTDCADFLQSTDHKETVATPTPAPESEASVPQSAPLEEFGEDCAPTVVSDPPRKLSFLEQMREEENRKLEQAKEEAEAYVQPVINAWRLEHPGENVPEGWEFHLRDVAVQLKGLEHGICVFPSAMSTASVNPASSGDRQVSLRRADGITKKRLQWLWPSRVPLGKITTFAGLPGEAKSLVTIDMAAVITSGRKTFGDESPNTLGVPADVLFIASEDDVEDTLVPRLEAAGADLSRVQFVIVKSLERATLLALDEDMAAVRKAMRTLPNVRLIVIDPITNHLGKVKMVDEQAVRDALAANLQIENVAVILVAHLNKKEGLKALQRVSGAGAFIGVARASWMFTSDPQDPAGIREMLPLKNNLTKRDGGLQFTVESKPVMIEGETEHVPFVSWKGRSDRTADEALAQSSGEGSTKIKKAVKFLSDYLSGGPKPQGEVEEAADDASIRNATLRRAKERLKVVSEKAPGVPNGGWLWRLPEGDLLDLPVVEHVQGAQV